MVYDSRMSLRALARGISFAGMAVGLLFVVFVSRALLMPTQADTYLAPARGRRHLARPASRPACRNLFVHGRGWPWRDHEWLWQPISYACFALGGMPLLTLCGAAFVVAALGCLPPDGGAGVGAVAC